MVSLDGNRLTLQDVRAVAIGGEAVQMDSQACERMDRARRSVMHLATGDSPIYAVNTGVGLLANTRLSSTELEQLQLPDVDSLVGYTRKYRDDRRFRDGLRFNGRADRGDGKPVRFDRSGGEHARLRLNRE